MSNREGIEIDYCPQCRGVWLDRGELDKIVERAPAPAAGGRTESHAPVPPRYEDDDRRYHQHDEHKRKRRGFLGELFDFD